jgi:hypothetical protein
MRQMPHESSCPPRTRSQHSDAALSLLKLVRCEILWSENSSFKRVQAPMPSRRSHTCILVVLETSKMGDVRNRRIGVGDLQRQKQAGTLKNHFNNCNVWQPLVRPNARRHQCVACPHRWCPFEVATGVECLGCVHAFTRHFLLAVLMEIVLLL